MFLHTKAQTLTRHSKLASLLTGCSLTEKQSLIHFSALNSYPL